MQEWEYFIRRIVFIGNYAAAFVWRRAKFSVFSLALAAFLPAISGAQDEEPKEQYPFFPEVTLDREALQKLYAHRDNKPIWLSGDVLLSRATVWLQVLQKAYREGLDVNDYHLFSIKQLLITDSPNRQLWLEPLLTDALLKYSVDVHSGQIQPSEVDPHWHIKTPEVDGVSLVRSLLDAEDFATALSDLPPPHIAYHRLRKGLEQYRRLAKKGGWPVIPDGPDLKIGDTHQQVVLLHERLLVEGDLRIRPVTDKNIFDEITKEAVERFQVRYGIDVDGVLGPSTRAAMNIPIGSRINQIKTNMARWRWLPRSLGERHILVNSAGFELQLIEDNRTLFTMRVITGKPDRPTPVVSGILKSVVLNPHWNVPVKLAIEDLIPKQLVNSEYFQSKGIRVFTNEGTDARELDPAEIDWGSVSEEYFPYQLRQDSGSRNSLGRVKFKFDNDFSLFLHDTPKRRLFDKSARAFSSGCIRVENAVHLAHYLLQGENGWTRRKIQETISQNKTLTIKLPETIPIYLVYWTAWVGIDGELNFRKDIYSRDPSLNECG